MLTAATYSGFTNERRKGVVSAPRPHFCVAANGNCDVARQWHPTRIDNFRYPQVNSKRDESAAHQKNPAVCAGHQRFTLDGGRRVPVGLQ